MEEEKRRMEKEKRGREKQVILDSGAGVHGLRGCHHSLGQRASYKSDVSWYCICVSVYCK